MKYWLIDRLNDFTSGAAFGAGVFTALALVAKIYGG